MEGAHIEEWFRDRGIPLIALASLESPAVDRPADDDQVIRIEGLEFSRRQQRGLSIGLIVADHIVSRVLEQRDETRICEAGTGWKEPNRGVVVIADPHD